MKLQIKNMVCDRCIMVVQTLADQAELQVNKVDLGFIYLKEEANAKQIIRLDSALKKVGFELLADKDSQLIAQIKNAIIELVQLRHNDLKVNLSDYLSDQLKQDYHFLSHFFSSVEGSTIEKYYISQKIEKVKELLVYDELSLNEISHLMHYSSMAHLSAQFKKVTGQTPSQFKKAQDNQRVALDKI